MCTFVLVLIHYDRLQRCTSLGEIFSEKCLQPRAASHLVCSSFTNRQWKINQRNAPSVLVPCHQFTSQWPTVNSPSAPDGEPAINFALQQINVDQVVLENEHQPSFFFLA
ncbi:hypothetical protein XENOCAPTIV_014972 [Xenoophorus captivus]|uniref:Uncharacterized protein n=1 Tax=Xenoophorus captivus TaxID=1517983 RepID=A0ABV0SA50_9TELE